MNTSAHVMIGLSAAIVGTVLAVAGLYRAICDRRALRETGVNGLSGYMASAAVRAWLLRIIVQLLLLVFFLLVVASARIMAPDADPWQEASLGARRWINALLAVFVALQSGWDLIARSHAGHIADSAERAIGRANLATVTAENERLRIEIAEHSRLVIEVAVKKAAP